MASRKNGKPRTIQGEAFKGMTMSGFCAFPSHDNSSHMYCVKPGCTCSCHETAQDK